jgi:CubicO group peptidase (beta-lactamase class C family)
MSKPMTAAAFMMLVDEGKIGLDDSVEKYLPEFRGQMLGAQKSRDKANLKKPAHPIKVREILSHTSGLPFSTALEQPTLDRLSLRDAVRSYATTPLQYEPGTKYEYSNAGINTAGRIIEVLSGMPYEEFMDKRLFQPLGMIDTTFWPSPEQLSRLAKSYKPGKNKRSLEETTVTQLRYPLDDKTRKPMPAGGLFSTAHNVMRFCQMILSRGVLDGKRYLSEDAVTQLTRKQTGDAVKEGYGLGWSTDGTSFGHGGAYSTSMTIDSRKGLIFVFLVQHAGFPGSEGDKIHAQFVKSATEAFGK